MEKEPDSDLLKLKSYSVLSKVYSEPCQISEVKVFQKTESQ